MHLLAKSLLEEVKPTLQKMLSDKISDRELDCVEKTVRIAHDLIDCDYLIRKMEKWSGNPATEPLRAMDSKGEY